MNVTISRASQLGTVRPPPPDTIGQSRRERVLARSAIFIWYDDEAQIAYLLDVRRPESSPERRTDRSGVVTLLQPLIEGPPIINAPRRAMGLGAGRNGRADSGHCEALPIHRPIKGERGVRRSRGPRATCSRTSARVELDPPLLLHGDVAGQGDDGVGQGDLAAAAGLVLLVLVVVRGVAVADAVGEVLELLAVAARGVGGRQAAERRRRPTGRPVLGLASSTGLLAPPSRP